MKDINIIMPEEVTNKDTVFFVCIEEDILDMDKYRKILATKDLGQLYNESKVFEWYQKWNYTPPKYEVVRKIFSAKERIEKFRNLLFSAQKSTKFFIGRRNCFQVKADYFLMKKSSIGFFEIHLSGNPLPYFYEERLLGVSNVESIKWIDISYYSYSITRMEKPYQDECFNYKTTKKDAIAECLHNLFIRNTFYTYYDLIDENSYVYQNQTFKDVNSGDKKSV